MSSGVGIFQQAHTPSNRGFFSCAVVLSITLHQSYTAKMCLEQSKAASPELKDSQPSMLKNEPTNGPEKCETCGREKNVAISKKQTNDEKSVLLVLLSILID